VRVCECVFGLFLGPHPLHMEVPRLEVESTAAGLQHSHSNARFKPHLQPTPQLMAAPDSSPTEWGRGSNRSLYEC